MAAALLQNRWLVGTVTAGRGTLVRIVVLDFLHLLANQCRFRAVLLVVRDVHRNWKKKEEHVWQEGALVMDFLWEAVDVSICTAFPRAPSKHLQILPYFIRHNTLIH